ncbi:class I SAM-dependent methyltransferase [Ancylomarina salipaludis]|uniref:Class I SAM-dependent methyltransferase n=1 Tax=Ancylomarina salipaludis TaxID=2501299 RepID=A0A4Q1JMC9_9BACT|nr:methyltransferase domain-containing protein [Ancylomarina salipaludis]RXQ95707.1 class I SAM-dependent methyltransferase [Ancylomarina salipaludis]
MVKDIQQIIQNLLNFYDFQNKTVVSVGAGGGQFIAYAQVARHVIAIDNDKNALNKLEENLSMNGLSEKFTLIHSDFGNTKVKGDLVLFEFCLHEMNEPQKMLEHAQKIAKDIVIADHGLNSDWAYIADEKEKAENTWAHVLKNPTQKLMTHKAEQYYEDYEELYEKVKIQGENSIERIKKFKKCKQFVIPMEYTFALL